jgi:hypothetical protein
MIEVRERLNTSFRKHWQSDVRSERMIQVAVEQLGLTLDFLDFAIEDYEAANAKYRAEYEQFMEDVRFNESGGETKRTHSTKDVEERRRGYFLLHYRIDTLYVFARILLDDIAVLLKYALAPSPVDLGNSHKGIAKHLPTIASAKGLTGYEDVIAQGDELTALVKDFRDDYVVHRSGNRPRATRSLTWNVGEEETRINYGLSYPREGEDVPLVQSTDLMKLRDKLDRYVDAVLDFIEPCQS